MAYSIPGFIYILIYIYSLTDLAQSGSGRGYPLRQPG